MCLAKNQGGDWEGTRGTVGRKITLIVGLVLEHCTTETQLTISL